MDLTNSIRLQDTLCQTTTAVAGTSHYYTGGTTKGPYERGNSDSCIKGGSQSSSLPSSAVCFDTVLGGEGPGDRGVSPCDKSQGPEQISHEGEI